MENNNSKEYIQEVSMESLHLIEDHRKIIREYQLYIDNIKMELMKRAVYVININTNKINALLEDEDYYVPELSLNNVVDVDFNIGENKLFLVYNQDDTQQVITLDLDYIIDDTVFMNSIDEEVLKELEIIKSMHRISKDVNKKSKKNIFKRKKTNERSRRIYKWKK